MFAEGSMTARKATVKKAGTDARSRIFRTSIHIDKPLWVTANKAILDEKIEGIKSFSKYVEKLVTTDLKKRGEIK